MRIALQSEIPGLVDQLQCLAPDIEAFVVPDTNESGERRIMADVLLGTATGRTRLPALIERCEGLRWLHILGTGVDKFPLHLVEDKLVTCSRGATAGPIAEWVMAMLLAHEKQLPDAWITEPPQAWYMADLGCLENKTLGIIGFGAIGQAIAKRALPFDMNIIAKVRTHRTSPVQGVELVAVEHVEEALVGEGLGVGAGEGDVWRRRHRLGPGLPRLGRGRQRGLCPFALAARTVRQDR